MSADIAYPPTTGARRLHETPLVAATASNLAGLGELVSSPAEHRIEIVRWPASGWRPVDPRSGDQGGVTEGLFEFQWRGQTLYARNNAVGDSYLFGWSTWPEEARTDGLAVRERALVWRANYHPDGGQLFYPLYGQSFVIPLALAGDDPRAARPQPLGPEWDDRAREIIESLLDGRTGDVHARASSAFQSQIPVDQLDRAWRTRNRDLGQVAEVLVTCSQPAGRVIADARITFAYGTIALRIGFEPSGEIAGLRFLPPQEVID